MGSEVSCFWQDLIRTGSKKPDSSRKVWVKGRSRWERGTSGKGRVRKLTGSVNWKGDKNYMIKWGSLSVDSTHFPHTHTKRQSLSLHSLLETKTHFEIQNQTLISLLKKEKREENKWFNQEQMHFALWSSHCCLYPNSQVCHLPFDALIAMPSWCGLASWETERHKHCRAGLEGRKQKRWPIQISIIQNVFALNFLLFHSFKSETYEQILKLLTLLHICSSCFF